MAGGVGIMSMDYLGGFQYQGTALKFFPTAEGYVQATALKVGFAYSYVYNYRDHLGNIRLSYAQDPENPNALKILEESHYYPFGLKHTNYNSDQLAFREKDPGPGLMLMAAAAAVDPVPQFVYNYKYNGKEFQDEMGLNWYDYGARNYDPAIGRWMNIDPLAEQRRRWSPYAYAMDNPVYFVDPDGMLSESFIEDLIKKSNSEGQTTWTNTGNGAFSGSNGNSINDNENSSNDQNGDQEKDGKKGGSNKKPSYTPPPKELPGFPDAQKVKPKGGRPRWKLPNGEIIEWDGQHGELERYNKRGKHTGVWTPEGEMIKDPVPGRKIDPITKPSTLVLPTPKSNSPFMEKMEKITGLTGTALIIYIVVSEGSRLFPPRNLIPIP